MTSRRARRAGGKWLAVCLSAGLACVLSAAVKAPTVPVEVTWSERSSVDSGGGHKGPWRMNASACDEDPSADIHVAKSDDQGRSFGEPRIAADGNGRADAPKLVLDSQGTLHLVYSESAARGTGGPHIHYTRSTDGELRFEPPRDLTGNGGEPWTGGFPHLAVDGQDQLYVVWELFPDPSARPSGLGFSRSMDGGRTFSTPTVIPGTSEPRPGFNGGQQGLLMRKLAVSPAGVIAVGHSTHQPEEASHVWLIRGQAHGTGLRD